MKKQYQQLTIDERDLIAVHHANGFNISEIAKMLNRNKSTISRELTRNSSKCTKFYLPNKAHKRARSEGEGNYLKD
ncbi:helix-turn-helix domain-containing protein [Candidatus Omnitrophota bacterium]